MFKKTTVKEEAKQTKRDIGKTQRELGREKSKLEQEEARLIAQIKRAAQGGGGREAEVRALAKQLVQVRGAKTRLIGMDGRLGQVKTTATMMVAQDAMGKAVKSSTKAMQRVGKAADVQKMQKQMADFQMNMERMAVNEEMMDDALATLDEDDMDEQADEMTRQVLDEIGVSLDATLASAPSGSVAARKEAAKEEEGPTEDERALFS